MIERAGNRNDFAWVFASVDLRTCFLAKRRYLIVALSPDGFKSTHKALGSEMHLSSVEPTI